MNSKALRQFGRFKHASYLSRVTISGPVFGQSKPTTDACETSPISSSSCHLFLSYLIWNERLLKMGTGFMKYAERFHLLLLVILLINFHIYEHHTVLSYVHMITDYNLLQRGSSVITHSIFISCKTDEHLADFVTFCNEHYLKETFFNLTGL